MEYFQQFDLLLPNYFHQISDCDVLFFLYLEVLAMVRVFWDEQSISITLPLLIAITALSRFIILQGKEMDPAALVYEAIAIVLIAGAIVILRLRHSDKLGLKKKKNK